MSIRLNGSYSDEFEVKDGAHQGSLEFTTLYYSSGGTV